MEKAPIKKFAMEARRKLIDDVRSQLGRYGITANGILDPHTVTENELIIDLGNGSSQRVSGKQAIAQYRNLVAKAREFFTADKPQQAIDNFCEEWAYTWFNRLIAIRFMEVNRYIPVRVLSSEISDQNVPDLVKSPFSGDLEYTTEEKQQLYALLDADSKEDDIFRFVFFKQCNDLNRILPRLFENLDGEGSFSQLLVVLSFNDPNGVVYRLVNRIEEKWFDIYAKDDNGSPMGQIQIIGWMYQYYNAEPKDAVFAALKKNVKITKENIPAATQLFTPDWIVRYMVENSLGRMYVDKRKTEGIYADGRGVEEMEPEEIENIRIANEKEIAGQMQWKYFLPEAAQDSDVRIQLNMRFSNYDLPEQIKVIDPCMGSGHILCYLFDVLMQIYLEGGYSKREAVRSILENNLFGLEIDKRAAQIAYFAVMMKAREYDSGFFTRSKVPQPKVYEILESNDINRSQLKFFGNGLSDFERNEAQLQLEGILDTLTDAKEYGSILNMGSYNWELLRSCAEAAGEDAQVSMESIGLEDTVNQLKPLIDIAEAMGQKYDVVVTNPPYMGASGMNAKLSDYVKKFYPDSKSDLFAVFIERCTQMDKRDGYQAMITQHAWMFLSSFEKLRTKLQRIDTVNMAHLGARGFDEIGGEVVQTTSFVLRNSHTKGYKGTYCRLIGGDSEQAKAEMFVSGQNRYAAEQDNFSKIPGSPVAYWLSSAVIAPYQEKTISDYGYARSGLQTGNNDLFLKYWDEVDFNKIAFGMKSKQQFIASKRKWTPQIKGGEYRKWYGNFDYIVNWENDGHDIRSCSSCRLNAMGNDELFFKSGVTWSHTTSSVFGARFLPNGFLFNVEAPTLFVDESHTLYFLALLNSCVSQLYLNAINATMHYLVGNISALPAIVQSESEQSVNRIAKENISLSKSDWDSFETSWDFEEHPLV